ncbi:MAG: hypothetical protein ACI9MC_004238, partial [Kiritimatiellia bacterium]
MARRVKRKLGMTERGVTWAGCSVLLGAMLCSGVLFTLIGFVTWRGHTTVGLSLGFTALLLGFVVFLYSA